MAKKKTGGSAAAKENICSNLVYMIAGGVVLLICIGILVFAKVYHPTVVIGSSMAPTYRDGEMVSTTPYTGQDLSYGEVLVLRTDSTTVIKRVVGLPGDTIQIMNGVLIVNGQPQDEEYPLMEDAGLAADPVYVPDDGIFVLGDNRNGSVDSRVYGCIPKRNIISIVEKKLL